LKVRTLKTDTQTGATENITTPHSLCNNICSVFVSVIQKWNRIPGASTGCGSGSLKCLAKRLKNPCITLKFWTI